MLSRLSLKNSGLGIRIRLGVRSRACARLIYPISPTLIGEEPKRAVKLRMTGKRSTPECKLTITHKCRLALCPGLKSKFWSHLPFLLQTAFSDIE